MASGAHARYTPAMPTLRFAIAAGPSLGLGHLRRMQVLAAAARAADLSVALHVGDAAGPRPADLIADAAWPPDLPGPVPAASWDALPAADALIVDGAIFDAAQCRRWRRRTGCLVVIDDTGAAPRPADLLVNPGLAGGAIDYAAHPVTAVLRGPAHALVDARFFAVPAVAAESGRVVVAFGASDDGRVGGPVAEALLAAGLPAVDLVTSPLWPVNETVAGLVAAGAGRLVHHHGAEMAALLADAWLYCGAAGVTVGEALAAGRAVVAAALVADQAPNIAVLKAAGLAAFAAVDPAAMAAAAVAERAWRRPRPALAPRPGGPARVIAGILARLAQDC